MLLILAIELRSGLILLICSLIVAGSFIKPVAKSITNDEWSSFAHSLATKPSFMIFPENVEVLDDAVDVQRNRAVQESGFSTLVNWACKGGSPFISGRPQHIARGSQILWRSKRPNRSFCVWSKGRIPPNVNAVGRSFATIRNMNVCADAFAFRVRDDWITGHVEGDGPQVGTLLLSERLPGGFQSVLSGCRGTLGGIGRFFHFWILLLEFDQRSIRNYVLPYDSQTGAGGNDNPNRAQDNHPKLEARE